jgi:hypothetical protein
MQDPPTSRMLSAELHIAYIDGMTWSFMTSRS